jgi:hypothetical protein
MNSSSEDFSDGENITLEKTKNGKKYKKSPSFENSAAFNYHPPFVPSEADFNVDLYGDEV